MSTIHKIWWDFKKQFRTELPAGKSTWKFKGFKLIEMVREWAKAHPRDVRIMKCDDESHATSALVFVDHKTNREYMGTSVVFIPQCTGEDPTVFFLYPGNQMEMIETLEEIGRSKNFGKRLIGNKDD